MALAVKRIVLPEKRWHALRVIVSSVDYDREDDERTEDGRLMSVPHKRTFREVIDTAHQGAASRGLLTKHKQARIINVEYYQSEGDAAEWHFTWEYHDYPTAAQMYRAHVQSCSVCSAAEERSRVMDHRCELGNKLMSEALKGSPL